MKRPPAQAPNPAAETAVSPQCIKAWRPLAVLLALFILFGMCHLVSTPTGATGYQDAPDESAHFEYLQTLRSGSMPSQRAPHGSLPYRYPDYEWHQPPLYYALALPLAGEGERAVRLLSILCGLGTILCIYATARLIKPDDPYMPLMAAGIACLTPAHTAILSAFNNDSLLELCFSGAIYLMARSMTGGTRTKDSVLLGAVVGAALLTKTTAVLLLPLVVISVLVSPASRARRAWCVQHCSIVFITAVLISGWWYARNLTLYGQLMPLHAFQKSFGGTAQAADVVGGGLGLNVHGWAEYWLLVIRWCFQSFWAVYGTAQSAVYGVPLFLQPSVYLLALILCVTAGSGMVRMHINRDTALNPAGAGMLYLQLGALLLVTASYAAFTSVYFQTQGRYIYPAMSAICTILAMGYLELFPRKYKPAAVAGALSVLGLVCLAFTLQTWNRSAPIETPSAPAAATSGTIGRTDSFLSTFHAGTRISHEL